MIRASVSEWPLPVLDRAGQETFWDRQSETYGLADMTRDNAGELRVVEDFCMDFVKCGYKAEDVVTLGGATGCRDPLVVTDTLARFGQQAKTIYYNDLSRPMVDAALAGALSKYPEQGVTIAPLYGPIHEIAHQIPPLPRRVIIGVYSAQGFTEARPEEDYPSAGLEEYLRNGETLGDRFIIEPVAFRNGTYENLNEVPPVLASACEQELARRLSQLRAGQKDSALTALRVVGQHIEKPGFFISHWFTMSGVLALIESTFPEARRRSMHIAPCAKGFVVCIDPVEPPRGILTILNNVVGNVLPGEHVDTLRAIERMSS